ncbi:Uncharacterised protein [Enterobacter cancerogenus]|uniref:Uncharacterized protein n=1 Tax=Enterobacter cancerogenus TaxID=69218 RepID=A0A484XAT3_9ENTR|nr:Uncharacterised protein [Enterobacter cancerogenus]
MIGRLLRGGFMTAIYAYLLYSDYYFDREFV